MDLTNELLSGCLDLAWNNAPEAGNSLVQQFKVYEQAALNQFVTVGNIGAVSKNGASQSFRSPALSTYSIGQLQTAWRSLVRLYLFQKKTTDWLYAQTQLVPPNANFAWFTTAYPAYATDADPAVYQWMTCWLDETDFTSYEDDFSELRLRPTAFNPPAGTLITW